MRVRMAVYYRTMRKHMVSLSQYISLRGRKTYKETKSQWQDATATKSYQKVKYPERRIVLIGKTGSGKSATGNNIMKREVFKSGVSAASLTRRSVWSETKRFNRIIQVIDTPGLFDTNMPHEYVKQELIRSLAMVAPGPHAFVIVLPVQRFTKEDEYTVRLFKAIYGDDMMRYSIVLFTGKDSLREESGSIQKRLPTFFQGGQQGEAGTIEEFVQNVPPPLKNLLSECGDRFVAFNNKGSFWNRNRDVRNHVEMVDEVVANNGNCCYTNSDLKAIEEETKKEERKVRRRLRRKKRLSGTKKRAKLRENLNSDSPSTVEFLLYIGKQVFPIASTIIHIYNKYSE